MQEAFVKGFSRLPGTLITASLARTLDILFDIAEGTLRCSHQGCQQEATHLCASTAEPEGLCEQHRFECHGGCAFVYVLRKLTVPMQVWGLRFAGVHEDLLIGRTVVRSGAVVGGGSIITGVTPGGAVQYTSGGAGAVSQRAAKELLDGRHTFLHAPGMHDYCCAISGTFVAEYKEALQVPLWGLWNSGDQLAANWPALGQVRLDAAQRERVTALLTPAPGHDATSAVLHYLLEQGLGLGYIPNVPTLPEKRVLALTHVPMGSGVDTVPDGDALPIIFSAELLGPLHFGSFANSGRRVPEWAGGAGFGIPFAYFSPPWCVGAFGLHAEQCTIESVNISARKSQAVIWTFANITFKNKLAVQRLQRSVAEADAHAFYKGALLPAALLPRLGFEDHDTVVQTGGQGIIARSYHWGVQCGKMAIAYLWMGPSWIQMPAGSLVDSPAAP